MLLEPCYGLIQVCTYQQHSGQAELALETEPVLLHPVSIFNQHLPCTYCMLGVLPIAKDTALIKIDIVLAIMEARAESENKWANT